MEKLQLNDNSDNIKVDGYSGTWYVIDTLTINGQELFLLEHERYGDDTPSLIVDKNGELCAEDVCNGFFDYTDEHYNEVDFSFALTGYSNIDHDLINRTVDFPLVLSNNAKKDIISRSGMAPEFLESRNISIDDLHTSDIECNVYAVYSHDDDHNIMVRPLIILSDDTEQEAYTMELTHIEEKTLLERAEAELVRHNSSLDKELTEVELRTDINKIDFTELRKSISDSEMKIDAQTISVEDVTIDKEQLSELIHRQKAKGNLKDNILMESESFNVRISSDSPTTASIEIYTDKHIIDFPLLKDEQSTIGAVLNKEAENRVINVAKDKAKENIERD